MKFACEFCVLFQFHMLISHVSVMLRDRSSHEPHMWPHMGSCGSHVGHTISTCALAGPYMCLTCEKCFSQVWKRVKLEQNMWATCEPHVDSMWFFSRSMFSSYSLLWLIYINIPQARPRIRTSLYKTLYSAKTFLRSDYYCLYESVGCPYYAGNKCAIAALL